MADTIYTTETVVCYFYLWDSQIAAKRPTADTDPAWLPDPAEVLLRVRRPDGVVDTYRWSDSSVRRTVTTKGEFFVEISAMQTGTYGLVWKGEMDDEHVAITEDSFKTKATKF